MDGLLQFEWLQGPNAGAKGKGFPYRVKKVDSNSYFLNWSEQETSSFITLFIQLSKEEVHSSGIINPGTEEEMIIWHRAEIVDTSIQ